MQPQEQKIKLVRIAHVYYTHSDMDKAHTFLTDFGLTAAGRRDGKVFYKGYGRDPFVYCAVQGGEKSFGGAAFVVESMADLERASQVLPKATAIGDLDAPGGGKKVTFYDPQDGFPMHLVYGQQGQVPGNGYEELDYNYPQKKNRDVNKTQRFTLGPAMIHKLGHVGCCVTDFDRALAFYTAHFNFKPSDLVHNDAGRNITAFLHIDRGMERVDHHTFFFFEGPKFHVHHSSFEVHDFDSQSLGHQWLRDRNYDIVWGVGRHVLGSQIFDYWWDTSGFMVEHYADGDLVDETTPIGSELAGPNSLHIWGPPLPETFLR